MMKMMNEIKILNKHILLFMNGNPEFFPEGKFALIRFMSSKSHYKINLPENCIDSLDIYCDDVCNPKMSNADMYRFFSSDQASNILSFMEHNHDKIETLIVACEAGISRSAGCAAALEKIYFNTDQIYNNTRYFPNSLIYRTILNKYYGER